MSIFSSRMATGLDAVYDRMGDAAVYTDCSEYRADCIAILDRDLSQYGETAELSGKTAVISVRISQIAERPRRGDTFSITETGEDFTVDSVLNTDDFEHRCLVA